MTPVRAVVVAWAAFQPRSRGLAADLGGVACFIHPRRLADRRWLLPIRYAHSAWSTWRALERHDPAVAIAVTPPVFDPLAAWAWARWRRRILVIDCHTGAFDTGPWTWSQPLHRWLFARATAVLLHTEDVAERTRRWRGEAFVFPDDLPAAEEPAAGRERPSEPSVVVAGSLDRNEPVAEALATARLLPGVRFAFTGDVSRLPARLVASAPPNVVFTGWLDYPRFLDQLLSSTVTAVFSTDRGIMNRAAFEAVGLHRALVLSDLPGLRRRFGAAALFTPNRPEAMAGTVARAIEQRERLEALSRGLGEDLRRHREDALRRLEALLARDSAEAPDGTVPPAPASPIAGADPRT